MSEQIRKWFVLLESEWWGSILVYALMLISTYSTIWALIEPLNVQAEFEFFASTIDRRFIHVVVTFFVASHLTLLLVLIQRRRLSSHERNLTPTVASDTVSCSLKILDEADRYLSVVAHQIRLVVRPYRRADPLAISELFRIWSDRYDNTLTESDFRKLLTRLQQQKRLAGLIFQSDNVFAKEEYYGWKTTVATDAKIQIATKAIAFIDSGDVVILDSGSTTIEIARQIGEGLKMHRWKNLTVITNFIKAADELAVAASEMVLEDDSTLIRVYLAGGRLRPSTFALIGDEQVAKNLTAADLDAVLEALGGADLAFVGTNGICWGIGCTTTSISETRTKEVMLKWARHKFIVADPSKFGLRQENVFATFGQGLEIITTRTGEKRILDDYERWLDKTPTRIIYA